MKWTFKYLYVAAVSFLLACNTESGIFPESEGSTIKVIPGIGDGDLAVSISLLENDDYLIISNTTFLFPGSSIQKFGLLGCQNLVK